MKARYASTYSTAAVSAVSGFTAIQTDPRKLVARGPGLFAAYSQAGVWDSLRFCLAEYFFDVASERDAHYVHAVYMRAMDMRDCSLPI